MKTNDNELPAIFQNTPQSTHNELEAKAMAVLDELAQQYPQWVKNDIQKLYDVYQCIQNTPIPDRLHMIWEQFYPVAHDIKGQGATFGFPLMTDLGAHVCQIIKTSSEFTDKQMEMIKRDMDDMSFVLEQKLSGDGGTFGQKIKKRLDDEKIS